MSAAFAHRIQYNTKKQETTKHFPKRLGARQQNIVIKIRAKQLVRQEAHVTTVVQTQCLTSKGPQKAQRKPLETKSTLSESRDDLVSPLFHKSNHSQAE